MKRSGIIQFSILLALLAVVSGVLLVSPRGTQAAPSGTGANAPQKQGQTQLEYYTRTLTSLIAQTGYGAGYSYLQVSGDWVGYGTTVLGCGHCGTYTTQLHFINVLTNQTVDIKSSTWGYIYSASGAPQGVKAVKLYAPYVVWTQPGKTVPGDGYNFAPGDFDCTICYYNLSTGKGGALQALQGLDPNAATTIYVMDVNNSGQVLARVLGASDLWVGKIGETTSQLIKTGLAPDKIDGAAFALFGRYIWLSNSTVYINDPNGGAGKQVGSGAERLLDRSLYFFWHAADGIQTYDGDPTGTSPKPNGKTVVPGATQDYDVQTTTDLGDIAAWITAGQDGTYSLKVASFGVTGGAVKTLLERKQKDGMMSVSLGTDKLVYIETKNYIEFQIELVWLVNADPAFQQVWAKADGPVASGQAARSWLWGPQANYMGKEQYVDAPGSTKSRLVRYYDKSRMEINNPYTCVSCGENKDPFYVSNGLLVAEMVSGQIQIGNSTFITASVVCTIPVAGDPRKDNPLTPSYSALVGVSSLHGDNKAASRIGQQVDGGMDVNGTVSIDNAHKNLSKYAAYSSQTGHNIPDLFWDYLQRMQSTYGFDWTFVLGYPISEAYWTKMRVGGEDLPVMIQAYQRRVLTYVPDFDPNWRVQMGNVGQHYFEWRYVMNK